MGNLTKKLSIFILVGIMIVNLIPWRHCHSLKDEFHFSKQKTSLNIDDAIHNDINIPLILIRFYHNKVIFYSMEFFDKQLQFFDINFLNNLISVVGILGTVLGIIFLILNKKIFYLCSVLIFLLTINSVEIYLRLQVPFLLKLSILVLPYFLLSVLGYWFLFGIKKINYVFAVISTVSILTAYWQVSLLLNNLTNYCV